jgi:hypothetical protein
LKHSIAHIINLFKADPSSDLYFAQPITFQSMINAKEKAKNVVDVALYSAHYAEDKEMAPVVFYHTKNLERSVIDFQHFEKPVKLPLIYDILENLYNASSAEYLIYTNVDIGLYPDFYLKVNEFIQQGLDAFIINRRRIPDQYKTISDLDLIYLEEGKTHPGFDCFVFHRSLFPKFKLEGICVGVPFIEISFSQNLFAFSKNFKLFENERLTFHIGMEIFKKRLPDEYYQYNRKQFWKLIPQLENDLDLKKFPFSNYVWPLRIIKWGLHPCIPIRLVFKLQLKRWRNLLGLNRS